MEQTLLKSIKELINNNNSGSTRYLSNSILLNLIKSKPELPEKTGARIVMDALGKVFSNEFKEEAINPKEVFTETLIKNFEQLAFNKLNDRKVFGYEFSKAFWISFVPQEERSLNQLMPCDMLLYKLAALVTQQLQQNTSFLDLLKQQEKNIFAQVLDYGDENQQKHTTTYLNDATNQERLLQPLTALILSILPEINLQELKDILKKGLKDAIALKINPGETTHSIETKAPSHTNTISTGGSGDTLDILWILPPILVILTPL